MFRRPFVRPLRRALRSEVHPLLMKANELATAGRYAEAASLYEQLARGAQARGIPRDAQLFLQAGRCHILSGQTQQGMVDFKQGLSILAQRGEVQRLQNLGQRIQEELKARGLQEEAAEIASLLTGSPVSTLPTGAPTEAPPARLLPTSCPSCGGPVRSDEVEWVDDASAECGFCGSILRTE
jgi:hypothetical protein